MTHGRPSMIRGLCGVRFPSTIDDEYLLKEGEGFQPPTLPSSMYAFVKSAELFDIMEEVLSTFHYRPLKLSIQKHMRLDATTSEAVSQILKLEAKLDNFNNTLPDILKPGFLHDHEDADWYSNVLLQRNLLRNRYVARSKSFQIFTYSYHETL